MGEEIRRFEADTQKVLDLVIHSLYSNRDIFLRELVSNAADAIDKLRFLSLTKAELTAAWEIRIDVDKKLKTISIADNGIGMTKDEVVENIGRIAQSGTKAFLKALQEKDIKESPELIGQFGVGFYSAFMVADKVTIETKRADTDAPAVLWESCGEGEYKLLESSMGAHGTKVVLHLKNDSESYLEKWKIQSIIRKYSDYIEYPIKMEDKDRKAEDAKAEKDETLNTMKAIWLRSPKEVTDEAYEEFFKHLSHSPGDSLRRIHYSAEGATEFKALLFIPSKSPFDMFFPDLKKKNLHLYIRRIFITDECPNLMPEYLRFISGVVDSNDLPLNVSRETLQDNPTILKIQKNLVRKVLDTLKEIKEKEPEKYTAFFKELGRHIKEGVHSDYANKEKLQELLLFETLKNGAGKLVSLKEYADAMPAAQKEIYYLIGESRNALENSPHLEIFKEKGFDVLFMTDPIDEFILQGMPKYGEKVFKAVGKGEVDLGDEKRDEKAEKKEKDEFTSLLEFIQKHLDEHVKEVRLSRRLTESACCLVGDAYDQSPYLEKIMRAMNKETPKTKRIMELNPKHPLVVGLLNLKKTEPESPRLAEYAELLYDQALLSEGSAIHDPLRFSKRLAELMTSGLGAKK